MASETTPRHQEAIGGSEAFLRCQERLSQAARVNRPLLLIGERGTGKELAARKVHYLSPRWRQPLVTLNCAALSPTLIESELFGHEAGAFTGAQGRRAGRFEEAHESTLFLDEIGTIPLVAQEKILRVVEYGTFERVGGSRTVEVDARIVAATNADLPAMAEAGLFKKDLLDRLAFEVIRIPPLRERGDDVLALARHFALRMAAELGLTEAPRFTRAAERALMAHPWPGNVRELKNVVERSLFRAQGPVIREIVVSPFEAGAPSRADVAGLAGKADMPEMGDAAAMENPGSRRDPQGSTSKPWTAGEAHWGAFPGRPASSGPLDGLETPFPPGGPATGWPGCAAQALPDSSVPFAEAVRAFELGLLRRALAATRHNQRKAAALMGLSYDQFRGLYRKYSKDLSE